jgi:hypothetical protein
MSSSSDSPIYEKSAAPIEALLDERSKTHGSFEDNARVAQNLRAFWRGEIAWDSMTLQQREALDMIALKISRILSGQAGHADHWDDIAGYALLALKEASQI